MFSSISFTKDEGSGDTYTCSFSVEPIKEFQSKVFVAKSETTRSKGSGKSGNGSKSTRKQAPKTTSGKGLGIKRVAGTYSKSELKGSAKTLAEAKNKYCKKVIQYSLVNVMLKAKWNI